MGSKIDMQSDEAEKALRDIRWATRRHFSAEDKVRIVIAGLRGEDSVTELWRLISTTASPLRSVDVSGIFFFSMVLAPSIVMLPLS
jgi:hypothetical protein